MDRLVTFVRRMLDLERLTSGWTIMRLDISGQKGDSRVEASFAPGARLVDRPGLLACLIDRGSEFRQLMVDAWARTTQPLPFEQAVATFFRRLPIDPDNPPKSLPAAKLAEIHALTPAQKRGLLALRLKAIAEKDAITQLFEQVIETLVPPQLATDAGWHFFRASDNPEHLLVGDLRGGKSATSTFIASLDSLLEQASAELTDSAPNAESGSDENPF